MNNTDLIFEELSVSDEVLKEATQLKQLIYEKLENAKPIFKKVYDNDGSKSIWYKEVYIRMEKPIFDLISDIYVKVYNFETPKEFSKYKHNIELGGETDINNHYISLNLLSYGGEVVKQYMDINVYHEVHHVYQFYAESKSKNVSAIYSIALNIINNPTNYRNSVIEFSSLIYGLNKMEIDAEMQSLYQELKNNAKISNVLMKFDDCKKYFEKFKNEYVFDEEFKNEIFKLYGFKYKSLMHYIENNLRYFDDKIKRVSRKVEKDKVIEEKYKHTFNRLLQMK